MIRGIISLLLMLGLGISQVQAQGVPIGALPNATTPLTGSEYTILSQNGTTVKTTVTNIVVPGSTIANNLVLGNVSGVTAAAYGITSTQLATMLGLGTAAYAATGTSGHTLGYLDTSNTWNGLQTLTGGLALTGPISLTSTPVGSIDNFNIGAVTPGTGAFTTLSATGTVTLNPTGTVAINPSSTLSIAPTGVLTINPTAASTMNNVAIGGTTPLAVTSTALTATGAVALSPASANVVLSPTGTGVVTINPATAGTLDNVSVGATTRSSGAFTTLAANGGLTVSASGAAITGNTSVSSGSFTASGGAFTASPASANVVMSPTGTGVVTINPATAGTMNNMAIGGSTPLAGAFTTVSATGQITSTLATGSAPFVVASTTNVANLNASTLTGSAVGTSGATIPLLNGANTWSGVQTFSNNDLKIGGAGAGAQIHTYANSASNTTITWPAGTVDFSGTGGTSQVIKQTSSGGAFTVARLACADLSDAGTGCSGATAAGGLTDGGVKTTSFNASANTSYCIDTLTTGAVTMTLPASPTTYDQIRFIDCKHNFATTNFTIARNGNNLMGLAANMTVSTNNAAATLQWNSTMSDWVMY